MRRCSLYVDTVRNKNIFMEQKQIGADGTRWDLSIFYKGLDDPKIAVDLQEVTERARRFQSTHKGKLAHTLGEALVDYAAIVMLEYKLSVFFSLRQSINVADAAVNARVAEMERALSDIQGAHLTFFELELIALSDEELDAWYARDAVTKKHRPWIEHVRVFKPHVLSESVESALTKRAPFGAGAWGEFFDELASDLEFDFRGAKKTQTEMLHILTESRDAEERFEAMRVMNAGLGGAFGKYSAQNLYMVVGANAVEAKERGYKNPMESRNKANRVPEGVVDALHAAVQSTAAPLVKRYYRLKAAHLGLKTLRWSDRNAAMPFSDATIVPFTEAQNVVLAAYESFSPTLAGLIREFVRARRIDAPAVKGKRGGAFNCSMVLPGAIPASFTFLNYLGSNGDAMTLAHELGHGVHGVLAGEAQGPLMLRAPIAYCETASVFGEMTTFNFLKKRLVEKGDRNALLALVMDKIDDAMNTVVRQIGFSNFERRIHGMDASYRTWSDPKKLSVTEFDAIWLETLYALYGKEGEVFTYAHTEHLWAHIPHFHNPFYVYGYAFGELLTQSIYAEQKELGPRFEPLYLDMLRSGMTRDAIELVKPFGLDPTQESFWNDGITIGLGAMIEEAEALSREMGVTV